MSHQRRLRFLLRSTNNQAQLSSAHRRVLSSSLEVNKSAAERTTSQSTLSSALSSPINFQDKPPLSSTICDRFMAFESSSLNIVRSTLLGEFPYTVAEKIRYSVSPSPMARLRTSLASSCCPPAFRKSPRASC